MFAECASEDESSSWIAEQVINRPLISLVSIDHTESHVVYTRVLPQYQTLVFKRSPNAKRIYAIVTVYVSVRVCVAK